MPLDVSVDVDDDTNIKDLVDELTDRLPESRIQESLSQEAERLGASYGELLILAARNLGDHLLTMAHLLHLLGLSHEVTKFVPNRNTSKTTGNLHIGIDKDAITQGKIKRGVRQRGK